MRRRWRDWPWSAKLALLLAALAVAPLSAVTLLGSFTARDELLSSMRAQNLQQARDTAQAVDRYLTGVLADVKVLSLSPWASRFLDAPVDAPAPALEGDMALALRQMRDTHSFDAILLIDPGGTVRLATEPRLVGRSYVARSAFLTAVAGTSSLIAPRWDPLDQRVYLQASAPVRQPDGLIVGAVVGRVKLARLDEIVDADTDFAGHQEFGVLWDADGIRLSHPTQRLLRFQPLEPLPQDTASRLIAENRFGPHTERLLQPPVPLHGLVERSRWLLYDPEANPHIEIDTGEQKAHLAVVPLKSVRWLYGIASAESSILAALRQQVLRNLTFAGVIGLLAVALGLATAGWASRPLRLVGQTANAIAAGDMSRRVGLEQRDEVGQLATAFDAMAEGLAAKEAELRGHAGLLEHRVEEQTAALRASVLREQEARRKAEEANRIKDEFLSTLSHELRTPLNAILGWTWMLQSGSLDAAGMQRAATTIDRNARVQSQIVDDILDVSRIITGKLRLTLSRLSLGEVIEAAIETVYPAAAAKEIRIERSIDPGIPPVSGDPNRLQQIAWNLLSNAVKFTPAQGRIEVRLDRAGTQARLTVSDSGIGIRPDFIDFVFDRFRQADSSTTRTYGGLGLGLAIVRHLVELHGGTVKAESAGEGQGSTFTVLLPAAPGLANGENPQAVPARHEGPESAEPLDLTT